MQATSGHSDQPDVASALEIVLHPAWEGPFACVPPEANHSAWSGQLPFLCWLLALCRPGQLSAVGADVFPAYTACCALVDRLALPTFCQLLLETEGVLSADLRRRHDGRYRAFSRMEAVSNPLPEAIPDGSIDFLILGEGSTDWGSPDGMAGWHRKFSPEAILVLHGSADQGTAARWRNGSGFDFPSFTLRSAPGLVVLAPGTKIPAAVAPLFALPADSTDAARLQTRFALLGERWRAEALAQEDEQAHARQIGAEQAERNRLSESLRTLSTAHDRLRDELAASKADRFRLEKEAADGVAQLREQEHRHQENLQTIETRAETRFAALSSRLDALLQATTEEAHRQRAILQAERDIERAAAAQALQDAEDRADALARTLAAAQKRLDALQSSVSWRATHPLRLVRAALRAPAIERSPEETEATDDAATLSATPMPVAETQIAPAPEPAPATVLPPLASIQIPELSAEPVDAGRPNPAPGPAIGPNGWRTIRRILFVAGEPGTPGATYRTVRNAAACRAAGYEAEHVDITGVNPDNLAAADLLVLWRAGHSGHVQTMLDLAAEARTRVAFDIDDLIFQPSLAVAEIIDGIRTAFVTEAESRSYFQSMQRTLTNSDLCITTTRELAEAAGRQHPFVQVIPNSFDPEVERASRRAVRLRGERSDDGLVRLGYAGGTRTHQRDFATIAPSLAAVLRDRPQARLTLFRDGRSGEGLVLVDEFPELLPFAGQIEWRDMVPLAELPGELARFDISLCPLEHDNPFCEAKSELKYFESALAGVCLVASPTGPFRRAVSDGVTGFLPASETGWTKTLLRLVDDPTLRHRVARDARNDVLWRFGPRRQAELWALLLAQLNGGVSAARAADLALRRGDYPPAGLPEVPEGEVLFSFDRLGEAHITVGMTSYNYEAHLGEALESVSKQTLEHLDLVVVDDGSRDGSVPLLLDWAERNRTRFNRLRILRTRANAGLGGARNLVFDQAETPWIMVLDSDNHLAPHACETLLHAVEADGLAAFAYPRIRQFGGAELVMGADDFQPARLASGNYIDAMALVAKWAWAAAGGYYVRRDAMGWEDFSLWCRLAELGLHGVPVPDELGFYRVHASSMVNAITEQSDNKRTMVGFVEERHPWLRLRMRAARKRLERPAAR